MRALRNRYADPLGLKLDPLDPLDQATASLEFVAALQCCKLLTAS